MAQHGVGQAQVALGVLKVNRVDFVRHGARPDLAGAQFLFEITQRHVAPDVAREVNQNRVGARHCVKQLGHVIVRLDLRAVGLKLQPQAQRLGRCNHAFGEGLPIEVGPSAQVRVVVAHRTVHLAQYRDIGDALRSGVQTHHHVGDLFAHGGRAGGLTVRTTEHGHIGKRMGHVAQAQQHPVEFRQDHHVPRRAQLQGVAGVVDVFAGTGEMHEFGAAHQLGARLKFGFEPVLHGFHIVVGGFFDVLDRLSVGAREIAHQTQQIGPRARRQGFEFFKTGVAQRNKPGDFDLHAAVHVAQFAHHRAQRVQLGGVAAVQWRQGIQNRKCHLRIVGAGPCKGAQGFCVDNAPGPVLVIPKMPFEICQSKAT